MFTGLVAEEGTVAAIERGADGARLRIDSALGAELAPGDSVAVNGACLTATEAGESGFAADVMPQTLSVTTLGDLGEGDPVNLELPLRASDRLGGHIVQGHVDGVATVASVSEDGFARRLAIELPEDLAPLVVERGAIAIEGVSLTVAAVAGTTVEVSLIPETLERTTLGALEEGGRVNVECDVLARYVQSIVGESGDAARLAGGDRVK
ncbi:MAG: riboflavin synthase [Solirubrobacterales bacterium]